jgi:hypothetical protein
MHFSFALIALVAAVVNAQFPDIPNCAVRISDRTVDYAF